MKLTGARKSFANQTILDGFNFEIPKGITCLFGPSGCGKTTLLNAFMQIIRLDAGQIDGGEKISAIFQDFRLLPWVTAFENIMSVSSSRRKDPKPVHELLDRLGLADAAEKYPGELSGGMKQRLNIARGLFFEHDILFMDEPFSGLDISLKTDIMFFVRERCAGKSVLFVTHDIDEAIAISDQAVILSGPPLKIEHFFEINLSRKKRKKDDEFSVFRQQFLRFANN